MADTHHEERRTPDASYIHNPDVAHEISDVNVGAIAKFIVMLTVSTVLFAGLTAALFWYFSGRESRQERETSPPSPFARQGEIRLSQDAPRLQGAPTHTLGGESLELREPQAEMRVLRRIWDEQLSSSGVDPQTGANRIPIGEAKRIVVQTGLPARAGSEGQQPRGYEEIPTQQSSGRVVERRTQ